MKNFTLKAFLLAFTLSFFWGFAQDKGSSKKLFNQDLTPNNQKSLEETGYIRCGTVEYESYLQEKHPNRETKQDFENWLESKKRETIAQRLASPNVLQTIPVIFHVFTDGAGAENVSASLIQAQIDQLNIDYRNLAGSTYGVAADSEIEFCLAQQDESGVQLTEIGINRITAYGEGPFTDTFVDGTLKPNTQWDPTKYMNVWVADISGGLLGWAYWPESSTLNGVPSNTDPSDRDGVVVLYSSVGSVANPNPNGGVYASGRTLSHEVGHWLGLRHIWGDTSICDVNDNFNGDYCADTPSASGSNFGCPSVDSCPADPGADMVENYMDYTDDTCMDTFTADQVTRMLTVLANSPRRLELVTTSTVCQPPIIYDLDGRVRINNLNLVGCDLTIAPEIELFNNGNLALTSATISYDIDGGTPTVINWTGNLSNYGDSEIINLPLMPVAGGSHTFNVSVTDPNGGTDMNTSNDTDSEGFTLNQSFSGSTSIELSLTTDNYSDETSWEFRNSVGALLYSGGPYDGATEDNTTFNESFSIIDNECYTFTIFDSYGDGICCAYGTGSYTLTDNNGTVIFSGGEFADEESTIISTAVLSTDDFFLDNSITLYPNPVNDKLTIKLSNSNLPDDYKIYNMLGQVIKEHNVSTLSDLEVNTSNISNGMYFVKVSKGNSTTTLPFIKR